VQPGQPRSNLVPRLGETKGMYKALEAMQKWPRDGLGETFGRPRDMLGASLVLSRAHGGWKGSPGVSFLRPRGGLGAVGDGPENVLALPRDDQGDA
jgi:hypothetical protein